MDEHLLQRALVGELTGLAAAGALVFPVGSRRVVFVVALVLLAAAQEALAVQEVGQEALVVVPAVVVAAAQVVLEAVQVVFATARSLFATHLSALLQLPSSNLSLFLQSR